MAMPASTFHTTDVIGRREDLSDIIYNVTPTDAPFITSIPATKARQVLHEWQTDTLTAAATNAVLEGDDATTDAVTATTRLSNTCQISDKVPRVTGTTEVVEKAGRNSELAYQVVKMTKELRRDMEFDAIGSNNAEVTGESTVAREYGNMCAWIDTNTSIGSGGADGSLGNTARTDGTARAFTEDLLKTVIRLCFSNGGDPDYIMVGPFNKQVLSGFTGNATRMKDADDKRLVASIDLYQSDFGDLEVIPNRFSRDRDCWLVQKNMAALAYLRPVGMTNLAKTGDSERRQVLVEYTLEVRNERAHGLVADLTTS